MKTDDTTPLDMDDQRPLLFYVGPAVARRVPQIVAHLRRLTLAQQIAAIRPERKRARRSTTPKA